MQILRIKILGFMLLLIGLALCGAGFWLLLSLAQYQASSEINLETDASVANGQVLYEPYFFQTELEIIQSPIVLSNVVEDLNLNVLWGKKYDNGDPFKTVKSIKLLQSRIKLELVRNTTLLKIGFSSEDPNEAALIANAIAKSYQGNHFERRRQLKTHGIEVLAQQFREEEQNIKAKQENLAQLRKQLNLPNSELAEELLKSNYPSYFQAKQQLQEIEEVHKLLTAKIEAEHLNSGVIADPPVIFTEHAEPPKFPVSPNRWLGAMLLAIGLLTTVRGFLLLKSSYHRSRT
jgi:uncharacterized protein involved in exopolysaccharide biosynthesis